MLVADSTIIRAAEIHDAAAINEIYNHYVQNTVVTFDVEEWNLARREQWLAEFNTARKPYHLLVAEGAGRIIGFAYNAQFRAREAYQNSTETTIYLAADSTGRGLGARLYAELFARLKAADLHRAYAVIALPNPHSLAFHRRFGFRQIGILTEVGYKFGGYVDTAWLEKALK